MLTFVVALAAGVGAVLRFAVDRLISAGHRGQLPLGTIVVNVSGSLVLGFVTGLGLHHGEHRNVVAVLGAGLTGGYTTLSTWAWESLSLAETGSATAAAVNVVGSFVLGLAAAAAGLGLALL
jgi:CrcB protein